MAFKADPKRVYEALLDAKQFQKVELLSDAGQSLDLAGKTARIDRRAGGTFSLFGDHIVGMQIELVENQRIVQAWRVINWDPGVYSIAKFELSPQGPGTKLVFDHTGFPVGAAEHLAGRLEIPLLAAAGKIPRLSWCFRELLSMAPH